MDNLEWWFVDLVCELRHKLAVLDSANIEVALNRRSHGLRPTQTRAVLARLRRRGWIEISGGYYGLTVLGGAAWEVRAQPDWSRFIDDSSDSDFRYVEGVDLERVRRCIEWRASHDELLGEPVFEQLRPFQATYWKALPEGFRATRPIHPKPAEPLVRCGSPEHAQLIVDRRIFLEYVEFAKWRPETRVPASFRLLRGCGSRSCRAQSGSLPHMMRRHGGGLPEGDSSVESHSPAAHSPAAHPPAAHPPILDSPAPDSPAWIRDAAARAWGELRLYVETAVLFTLRPGRFALEWVEGRRVALNPLAMLATAAGVLGTTTNLLGRLLGRSGGQSTLLRDVIAAVAPFAHYALLGALCHAVLRLFGSRRPLRDSLGLALFAGGGPAVGTVLLTYLVGTALWLANGRPTIVAGLMGSLPHRSAIALSFFAAGGFIAFFISFLVAMTAVHRVRPSKTVLALLAAMAIAALIFGALDSQAGFGPHLFWVRKPPRLDLWID